jgi:hypothetical protein
MTHYIDDLAVFSHIIANKTQEQENHATAYESYVGSRTTSVDAPWVTVSCGTLNSISPYDAAVNLAHDTAFDDGSVDHLYRAVWMDQHYNWSDPNFVNRAKQSINLAVNYVAEAVHATWSTVETTTTTQQQTTTSTTQVQTTTTSTQQPSTTTSSAFTTTTTSTLTTYSTTTTSIATSTTYQQTTTTVAQQAGNIGVGFAFAVIGIGAGAAAAGVGVAVAASGPLGSGAYTYGGYYYCRKHNVPLWWIQGRLWCPTDGRFVKP